jgi:hypothetical protein
LANAPDYISGASTKLFNSGAVVCSSPLRDGITGTFISPHPMVYIK